jgi:hypothetical protein
MNTPLTTEELRKKITTIDPGYNFTSFVEAPDGQLMNDFATAFNADNSAYENIYKAAGLLGSNARAQEYDTSSIFEKIMNQTLGKPTTNTQTFQNIITNT